MTRAHALLLISLMPLPMNAVNKPSADVWSTRDGLLFEQNLGQTADAADYLARTSNGLLLFTPRGVVLPRVDGSVSFAFTGSTAGAWEALKATGATVSYYAGATPASGLMASRRTSLSSCRVVWAKRPFRSCSHPGLHPCRVSPI